MQVNTLEAKNQLSRLIESALAGEDVVIARRGKPAVRLVPVAAEGEIDQSPGNPAWIAQWFKDNPINPDTAMTPDEADAYLAQERASWE